MVPKTIAGSTSITCLIIAILTFVMGRATDNYAAALGAVTYVCIAAAAQFGLVWFIFWYEGRKDRK